VTTFIPVLPTFADLLRGAETPDVFCATCVARPQHTLRDCERTTLVQLTDGRFQWRLCDCEPCVQQFNDEFWRRQ
jgi:hypothetical protein